MSVSRTSAQERPVVPDLAAKGSILEITSLAGGYGDLRVLWDVSLSMRPGSITAILGRNGAGKTTLLSAIAGIVKPDAGTITFAGKDITRTPAPNRTAAGLALVQENKRVFRRRSVEQNLLIGGHTMPRKDIPAAIEEAYERFPILGDKRKAPAGALSGGQQQMLAIAQALMPRPSLLMLDEPSAGLAPVIVEEVLAVVSRLRAEGVAVLLVEQLVDQALSVADAVAVLEHGRLSAATPIEETDRDKIRHVYFGEHSA
jgi:branched-chain amino acid transport system ATP-binding protein